MICQFISTTSLPYEIQTMIYDQVQDLAGATIAFPPQESAGY